MIRVGPAGWSYPDWETRVYPRRKPRGFHPLAFLSDFVGCVEVNSTFYAMPVLRHCERWALHVERHPSFRLAVKLHRDFTHGDDAPRESRERQAATFLSALEPLCAAGRLGPILAQFPASFTRTPQAEARLRGISEWLGPVQRVLELRHRSWFDEDGQALVARLGYSLAHIDLPTAEHHPPGWHAPTSRLGYLRLHGRNRTTWFDPRAGRDQRYDYLYSPSELSDLLERIRRLAAETDETYVITNNHFAGQAVANALELLAELGGAPVPAPAELVEAFPHLRAVTLPRGQQPLF